MNKSLSILLTLAAFAASPAWSQPASAHDHNHAQPQSAAAAPLTEGEVRKVDKENGKVTIKHGEIKALNMPPMTMVYPVSDPGMLEKVKAGDKVQFNATSNAGKLTVTEIRPAR